MSTRTADKRGPGRPAELGERRRIRLELQLGESEYAELSDAAGDEPLAPLVRELALEAARARRSLR